MAHFHNPSEPNQNLGNRLGARSCIRQSQAGRAYDSGNEMKGILGNPDTTWDVQHKEGAYLGQHVSKHTQHLGGDLTEKIGGERRQGFVSTSRKSKTAEITGKVGGREVQYEQPQMDSRAPAHYQGESLEADSGMMDDPRMGYAADLGARPIAGQIQSQLRPQQDRTDKGNPLSWGNNEAWQTTSSDMGGCYRR